MNKLRFIILSAAVVLLTAGCGGKGGGNSEKESANSAQSEMQSTENEAVTPQDLPFDPAAMPQLQPLDKLTPDDMTGVKAYGFYGKVKTVKLPPEEYTLEFEKEGNLSKSEYKVTFGKSSRKETVIGKGGDFDGMKFVTEYKFDKYGRLIFDNKGGGIDSNVTTYTYKGANAFPDSEKSVFEYEEGGGETTTSSYKYEEFDRHANWTKRTTTTVTVTVDYEGNKQKQTKTFNQTAEYTYYE